MSAMNVFSCYSDLCSIVKWCSVEILIFLFFKFLSLSSFFKICNWYLQVKIRNWMDNMEATELVGVSARFGEKISDRNVETEAIPLALISLGTSCNSSSLPVSISFLDTVSCFCSERYLRKLASGESSVRQYEAVQ